MPVLHTSFSKLGPPAASRVKHASPDAAFVEHLKERLLTVSPTQLRPVRTLLESHKAELIQVYWQIALDDKQSAKRFESILDRSVKPLWHDAPLDKNWVEPDATIQASIESAHGMIGDTNTSLALTIIHPPEEFLIGSPVDEVGYHNRAILWPDRNAHG